MHPAALKSRRESLRAKGFTLIEILVVMFIVSIMTGIAVANMPTFVQSGELDTEARRLMTLLRMVREEAVLQVEEYGLRVSPQRYEFLVYDDRRQAWSVVTESPFQARGVPDDMELALAVEETSLSLSNPDDEEASQDAEVPPVLLLSSGEATPFELTLAMDSGDEARTLGTDGYGSLQWRNTRDGRR